MNQVEIKKRRVELATYVLEMVTLLALGNLLGDIGIAYLAVALEIFRLFWTVTSGRIRDVLGKLLRGRSTRGQYKNVAKLKKNALLLEGVTALTGSVLLFVFSGFFGEILFGVPYCVVILRILAPAVALRAFSAVLLGYFQGEGTEFPTVVACALRQTGILVFSLLFVKLLGRYGRKVSALLKQENFTAMYGGMGVALAILVTEALLLLVLFLLYHFSRTNENRGNGERMRATDTFGSQVRVLYSSMLPLTLVSLLQRVPMWLGMFFYRKTLAGPEGLQPYGVLYGNYMPLIGILLFPGCIFLLENCYKVVGCVRRDERRYARENFSGGIHVGMIYGGFLTVFLAVFAPQVAGVLCKTDAALAEQLLRYGALLLLLTLLGFYISEILLLLGGKFQILVLLVLYDLLFLITLSVFLNKGKMGVIALLYAGAVSGAVYVAAVWALFLFQTQVGMDWLQSLAIPAGLACAIGLILLFVGRAITPHLGNFMTICVCLFLGVIGYGASLMLLHNISEQDMDFFTGENLMSLWERIFQSK